MNTNRMKIRLEIPLDYKNPDCNGNIYTKEAYMNLLYKLNIPLIIYDKNQEEIPIGNGNIKIIDDKLIFDGYVFSGGFGCIVNDVEEINSVWNIKDMIITSLGIDYNSNKQINTENQKLKDEIIKLTMENSNKEKSLKKIINSIKANKLCFSCLRRYNCNAFGENECIETGRKFFVFDKSII